MVSMADLLVANQGKLLHSYHRDANVSNQNQPRATFFAMKTAFLREQGNPPQRASTLGHSLGKGEVESSILSCSTSHSGLRQQLVLDRRTVRISTVIHDGESERRCGFFRRRAPGGGPPGARRPRRRLRRHSAARTGRSGWARRCAFKSSAIMNASSIA